jgi:hypothetical protein
MFAFTHLKFRLKFYFLNVLIESSFNCDRFYFFKVEYPNFFSLQWIVGAHSQFLSRLLVRRHLIEFDIVDLHKSLAFLHGSRLAEDDVR